MNASSFQTSGALRALVVALVTLAAAVLPAPAGAQTRPALVRDVDNGALQPFRTLITVSLNANESSKTVDGPVVPAGKRLVIENVSVWVLTSANDFVTGLWLTVPGADPATFMLLDPSSTERKDIGGGNVVSAYNRLVKLYYNPGEKLQAMVFFNGTTSSKIANLYLNGYYVNLP